MREPAAIFHATKEKSAAVGQQRRARIKNTVHGIRPIPSGKDGLVGWRGNRVPYLFRNGRARTSSTRMFLERCSPSPALPPGYGFSEMASITIVLDADPG